MSSKDYKLLINVVTAVIVYWNPLHLLINLLQRVILKTYFTNITNRFSWNQTCVEGDIYSVASCSENTNHALNAAHIKCLRLSQSEIKEFKAKLAMGVKIPVILHGLDEEAK